MSISSIKKLHLISCVSALTLSQFSFAQIAQFSSVKAEMAQTETRLTLTSSDQTAPFGFQGQEELSRQAAYLEQSTTALVWLSDQPNAIPFLVEIGYDKAVAAEIVALGTAIEKETVDGYFQSPNGSVLLDAFGFEKSFEAYLTRSLPELLEHRTDQVAFSNSSGTDANSDPCARPGFNPADGKSPQQNNNLNFEADFAALQEANSKFKAGLSFGGRDAAGFIGAVVGATAGRTLGTAIVAASIPAAETGAPLWALALSNALAIAGSKAGDEAGKALYDKGRDAYDVWAAEQNYEEAREAANEAYVAEFTADAEAREARGNADRANGEANEAGEIARRAAAKAELTGSSEDKKAASEAQKVAAEKKAEAQRLEAEAKEKEKAAEQARKKREQAENQRRAAKKQLDDAKKKKSGGTLPGEIDQNPVGDSPFTSYVKHRIMRHQIRILSALIQNNGRSPVTILTNPYADPQGDPSAVGFDGPNLAEQLKTPQVNVGSSARPCLQPKLKFAPQNGLSPTVINPDPDADPQPSGPVPVEPPVNPLD